MSGPSTAATDPSPLLPVLAVASLALITVAAAGRPALTGDDGLPSWSLAGSDAPSGAGAAPTVDLSAIPDPAVWAAQGLTALALVGVIVILGRRLLRVWRTRADSRAPQLPGRQPLRGRSPAIEAALADAAGAAATDLRAGVGGDPSDAVVRAWVRVEEAAAGSGATRAASQTATEFTADLLRRGMADPTPITTLLTLYGQARFGTEPLTRAEVGRARGAFDTVHRRLAAGRPG